MVCCAGNNYCTAVELYACHRQQPDTFVVPEVKVEYTALKYVTATPSSFPGME